MMQLEKIHYANIEKEYPVGISRFYHIFLIDIFSKNNQTRLSYRIAFCFVLYHYNDMEMNGKKSLAGLAFFRDDLSSYFSCQ